MTEPRNDVTPTQGPEPAAATAPVAFAEIDFPSDALSIRRLRTIFPALFDAAEGSLVDGYDNLFRPVGGRPMAELADLAELIDKERVLADYAFLNALDPHPSDTLDDECQRLAADARRLLERHYQSFRLADGPESARLLIQLVEEQATQQAERAKRGGSQAR